MGLQKKRRKGQRKKTKEKRHLFQFLADEVERLENGVRRAGYGDDPLGTGSIGYVDARTRLSTSSPKKKKERKKTQKSFVSRSAIKNAKRNHSAA